MCNGFRSSFKLSLNHFLGLSCRQFFSVFSFLSSISHRKVVRESCYPPPHNVSCSSHMVEDYYCYNTVAFWSLDTNFVWVQRPYHLMLSIYLRHFWWNHSNQFIWLWYVFHVSEQYSRDVKTQAVYIFTLALMIIPLTKLYFPFY